MKKIRITLFGSVPSKKNSKRRIRRGNHIFMVPSLNHEVWHTQHMGTLAEFAYSKNPIKTVKEIIIDFYVENKRKADLSNKAESIMDLLVDASVIEDDNFFVVPRLILNYKGQDKEKPRAEIDILL